MNEHRNHTHQALGGDQDEQSHDRQGEKRNQSLSVRRLF